MFRPGARIIHPELGDCTDDVIEALREEARFDEVIIERRQAEIARESGRLMRQLECGRVVAEIDPEAFAHWEHAHPGFFRKGNDGLDYLLKHFPATRVQMAMTPGLQTGAMIHNRAPKFRIRGRRGRWAT